MDYTVIAVALLGFLGTLFSPVLAHRAEVYKLHREQRIDRYDRVKNWVIQVMAVLNPAPITWRPDGKLHSWTEFTGIEPTKQTERLAQLNSQAAEVELFASGDKKLEQRLQDFINSVNSLGEGRDPDRIGEARSAAAKVVDRAYELMF